jgi:hypothetical protein
MIETSRVNGKHALSVFEHFNRDRDLPKFAKPKKVRIDQSESKFGSSDGVEFEDNDNMTMPTVWRTTQGFQFQNGDDIQNDWRHRFIAFMERLLRTAKKRPKMYGDVDPLSILLSVGGSLQEVKDYIGRVKVYDDTIRAAMRGGQKARVEQLKMARQVVQYESMLRAAGFKQYLSEAQAIDFAVRCQKGLRLDWTANFGRPIPDAVVAKKEEADALKVFDNYVILHYDPKETAFTLTKAQEAAKRDPILFGVIEGVRKLYFIGDWKDDECDLTMDEVSRVLGHPASEIESDPTVEP